MFLNELFRRFEYLLGAGHGLLGNASRDAANTFCDGLRPLRDSGCRTAHSFAARERELSSARLARRGGTFRFSSALAGSTLAATALPGSALASHTLASRALSAFRLSRRRFPAA